MTVTDLRTQIDPGTTGGGSWTDIAGTSVGTTSTSVFPPGASGSITDKVSKTIDGLIFDTAGSNFAAGDHLYLWYSFLFGALDTTAGGGIRVRVAGATITDYAEVFIDGNDSGKSGWQLAVVSLDALLANPDAIGGTPPTAANAQRVGIVFDVTATVGGNNDNVAVQGIWRSPASLIASYRIDAGTDLAPNSWDDLVSDSLSNAFGIVVREPNGSITLRCPIVFGPTDDTESVFFDEGIVLAWDLSTGLIEPDFYKLTAQAAAGVVRVTAGSKLGSGETAVGVNGWTIVSGGPRWTLDFEDPQLADARFYGCSFVGSGPLLINDPAVEVISCVFSDCDTIEMTGGASGPAAILSNFFAGAPGPRAQVVFTSGVTPTNGQFDFNTFANMAWFAIEIPSATTQFDLRGVKFATNGTNRDVLLSHTTGDIQLNVLENGDTPGVTNGATITVTMTGACDALAVAVGTWYEALGTETNDLSSGTGTLVTQTTASLAVDDDTFAIAAISPPNRDGPLSTTLDYTGTSDQYSDSNLLQVPSVGGGMSLRLGADEVTFAAATRVGFPVASHVETESVQGIVHVDAAVALTPVVSLDAANGPLGLREMRPWQLATAASTLTFSYGAGNSDATKGTVHADRFLYIAVVALDGVAANTLVSGIVLNRSGGTTALSARTTSFPIQDDNVGSTGKSLELHVFDYDVDVGGQDLDQGTYDTNNNVSVTLIGVTEGATVTMEAAAGGDLAEDTVIGTFPVQADQNGEATASHGYTNPQPVILKARYSGLPIAATQEDLSGGPDYTDYTTEANDSTLGNVILMPATEANGDAFYMGFLQEVSKIKFNLDTGRAGTWSLTWQYWNGGTWANLSNVVDGTSDFSVDGTVTFTKPTDSVAIDRTPEGSPTDTVLHFVRARITSFTSAGAGPTCTKLSGNPTRYLPYVGSSTIESTGLTASAVWVEDTFVT